MKLVTGGNEYTFSYLQIGGNADDSTAYLKLYDSNGTKIEDWQGLGGYDFFKLKNEETVIQSIVSTAYVEDQAFIVGTEIGAAVTLSGTPYPAASYLYQWQRSNDGTTWTDITNADKANYTPVEADYGKYLRRNVIAYGGAVGNMNTPNSTAVVGKLVSAAITGTAQVGQTLTAGATTSPASSGNPTYTYQWKSCATANGTFADISGATNSTYVCVADDVGKFIKVTIAATGDAVGTATSAATEAVS